MKKHIVTFLIIIIFLAGLSILLYPEVSNFLKSGEQKQATNHYYKELDTMNSFDVSVYLDAAREYNKRLLNNSGRFEPLSEQENEEYSNLLKHSSNDVIGVLEIDSINVNLPIYHGTDEGVLQIGVGHLEGTSLPVGGENTHTVLTGHRGLPSSKLLTNLDKLTEGDRFVVRILNESLIYQVDQIEVVEPNDLSSLEIESGMDYCTLVTCTPYSINSHRLLVRGQRVFLNDKAPIVWYSNAAEVDSSVVALIIIAPIFFALLINLIVKFIKIYGGRIKDDV